MAGLTVNGYAPSPLVGAIIKLQPNIKHDDVNRLAQAIEAVYADGTCTVPWQLVVSIAFHESTFRMSAVNKKTKDYGLMQISKNNIARMKLDRTRLMRDPVYSLKTACNIISYNQKKYGSKVNYWLGMYRSGNALWSQKIRNNAIAYDRMIRTTAAKIGYNIAVRDIARSR